MARLDEYVVKTRLYQSNVHRPSEPAHSTVLVSILYHTIVWYRHPISQIIPDLSDPYAAYY